MKSLAIALVCTTAVFAAQADTFFDNARVRSVEPQNENVSVAHDEYRAKWVRVSVDSVIRCLVW